MYIYSLWKCVFFNIVLVYVYVDAKEIELENTLNGDCRATRTKYSGQETDIYSTSQIHQLPSEICLSRTSCCKPEAERFLLNKGTSSRSLILESLEREVKDIFRNSSKKFEAHFRTLITDSQKRLDAMFEKTYGVRYSENSVVFQRLYKSLHSYLSGNNVNLQASLDAFFSSLFQKVYMMSKPFDTFSPNYQSCIKDSTQEIKPFGAMAHKITVQTLRSFIASRVFLRGLRVGKDTVEQALSTPVTEECKQAYTRMTECSVCTSAASPVQQLTPCHSFCQNVMKGCFAYITMIQPKWDSYVQDMSQLADKLRGPFSMEAIIGPLGVKISEAIMAFQDDSANITKKVTTRCGSHSRSRRSLADLAMGSKLTSEQLKNLPFLANFNKQNEKQETATDKMVSSVKSQLLSTKHMWLQLNEKFCSKGLSTVSNSDCWNGRNVSSYHVNVVGDDLASLFNGNPEVTVDAKKSPKSILLVARQLENTRNKIQGALEGKKTSTSDTDVTDLEEGSGSSPTPTTASSSSSARVTTTRRAMVTDDTETSGDTESSGREEAGCNGGSGEDIEGSAGDCEKTQGSGGGISGEVDLLTEKPVVIDTDGLPPSDMPNTVEIIRPIVDNTGNAINNNVFDPEDLHNTYLEIAKESRSFVKYSSDCIVSINFILMFAMILCLWL